MPATKFIFRKVAGFQTSLSFEILHKHFSRILITVCRTAPAIIRLDEDVLKKSFVFVFIRRLQDVLIKTNMFALALRLQDVLVKTIMFVLAIRLHYVRLAKTFSRHLQDVFKTFSRRLQDILQRYLQDVFKTYHQVKPFLLTRL